MIYDNAMLYANDNSTMINKYWQDNNDINVYDKDKLWCCNTKDILKHPQRCQKGNLFINHERLKKIIMI